LWEGQEVKVDDGGLVALLAIRLLVSVVGWIVVMFVILAVGASDAETGRPGDTAVGAIVGLKIGLTVTGNDVSEG